MNSFIYDIPTKVYFGEHQLSHLGEELAKYGKRVLLTYGGGSIKKSGLYDAVAAEVKAAGLTLFELSGIEPNPRIDSVRAGAALCKKERIDVLLAVGGGSTIDATKYIAAGACVDFDPWDFFSKWAPIERALPIVTVLTLSATGSEMDTGGVISNPETQDKIGPSRAAVAAQGFFPRSHQHLYGQSLSNGLRRSGYYEPHSGGLLQPGAGSVYAGLLYGGADEDRHQVHPHRPAGAGKL